MIDLSKEPIGCPQCGCVVAELDLHLRWHQQNLEIVAMLSRTTVDTAAAMEELVVRLPPA
jgi:hypothetical protein